TLELEAGFWADWLRLYLPAGAVVVAVDGLENVQPARAEFGRQLLAGYFPLAPGAHHEVRVRYELPGAIGGATPYQLLWEKQPGLTCRSIRVSIVEADGSQASAAECPTSDSVIQL